jgi:hypothetical protein
MNDKLLELEDILQEFGLNENILSFRIGKLPKYWATDLKLKTDSVNIDIKVLDIYNDINEVLKRIRDFGFDSYITVTSSKLNYKFPRIIIKIK